MLRAQFKSRPARNTRFPLFFNPLYEPSDVTLGHHWKKILNHLSKFEQQEVRWHVAPMLARLPLTETEEATVVGVLLSYTNDRSSIVKTMSMQALADIALRSHRLLPEIKRHIEELSVIGTPAMKARSKKLLRSLAKENHG